MAVKHINENEKAESGVFLSGKDSKKVFSLFFDDTNTKHIKKKKSSLNALFQTTLKKPSTK